MALSKKWGAEDIGEEEEEREKDDSMVLYRNSKRGDTGVK